MKVLVLGGSGMLGSDLIPVWSAEAELSCPPRTQCDITKKDQVRRAMDGFEPDLVLLLAASTDVDRCQKDPDYAFEGNLVGPMVVSQECARTGAGLLYVSTIAVFDGLKPSPYTEYDRVGPANTYGESKLQGELAVRTHCPRHWIVRTGWLFGGGVVDMKFVARILRLAGRDEIRVVEDCLGSPTRTSDLASGLLRIARDFPSGTYHLVNQGPPVSRYELARQILSIAGYPSSLAIPVLSSQLVLPAPRPRMEAAVCYLASLIDPDLKLPDWRSSLEDYIHTRLAEVLRSQQH